MQSNYLIEWVEDLTVTCLFKEAIRTGTGKVVVISHQMAISIYGFHLKTNFIVWLPKVIDLWNTVILWQNISAGNSTVGR